MPDVITEEPRLTPTERKCLFLAIEQWKTSALNALDEGVFEVFAGIGRKLDLILPKDDEPA